MFKVVILGAFALLWISAVLSEECLYQMEMWTSPDATKFYYCNPITNETALGNCVAGKGFVRNATITGCVPWDEWSDSCVNKDYLTEITCGDDTFLQPHGALDPSVFYLCIAPNTTAVALSCPDDRAFHAKDKYLGCFPWAMWRNLTGCL